MNNKLVIFDLDGTLLNTIADLATATNQALEACGFPTHPISAYPMFVGNGINKLFERALPAESRTEENIMRIRAHFLPYYDEHNADLSKPYPGIPKLLEELQTAGVHLAVASNKYQRATEKLIRHYFPTIRFAAVFGQREGIPVKPHPQIVEDILTLVPVNKEEVIYIGDSGVDMQTALHAGVESIGVTWGFRPKEELLQHSPTHLVDSADEIKILIND
jgi:phosphoglycolate phosphatase